jgi:Domain of unknown function (DUF5666)
LFSTLLTLAHRKGMMMRLAFLLLLSGGATLAACSSFGSGAAALQGSVASIDITNASFVVTPQQNSAGLTNVTVQVNPQTEFRGALHGLADLVVGMQVKVQGSAKSANFTATQVENEDQNDDHGNDRQRDEFKGTVDSIDSSNSSFGLTLADGSTEQVITDAQTEFAGSLHRFADLAKGQRVEVKGTAQSDNSILASTVENENEDQNDDANEDNDEHEAEGTGTVLSVGDSSFVLKLNAGSVAVTVSSATVFDGGLRSLADLKAGMRVEVKGQKQSNGSIAASRVHGEDVNDDGDNHGGNSGHGGDGSGDGGGTGH